MQVICPISGEVLLKSDLFLGEDYAEMHPIFRVPRSKFISHVLLHRFNASLNNREKKLYFLHTLYCTDLIEFKCIANPAVSIVERHFMDAFKIAGWLDYAAMHLKRGEVSFPRFIVKPETASLDNIGFWIAAMEEIKEIFMRKDKDVERSRLMRQENEKLLKELSDAQVKDRLFTPLVADWVLEVCGLHLDPRAGLWRKILLTKTGPKGDAWGLNRDTLEELKEKIVEKMIDTLSLKHPLVAPVLGQLNVLLREQKKGLTDITVDMVSLDDDGSLMDGEDVESSQTPVSRVSISSHVRDKFVFEFGELKKPERKDFASLSKYLQAVAQFRVASDAPPKATRAEEDADVEPKDEVAEHFAEEQQKISTDAEDEGDENG